MPYDLETKARAVVDAALTTDREAASDHGVSRRSIQRWRGELASDMELQKRVTELWSEVREAGDWVEDTTRTIRKALSFVRTATEELDPSDPEDVAAVVEAIEVLTEAKAMADVIETRIEAFREPESVHHAHRKN